MRGRIITKREYWLKLFEENNVALASAVILVERFVTEASLKSGAEFIRQKINELSEMQDEFIVSDTFRTKCNTN